MFHIPFLRISLSAFRKISTTKSANFIICALDFICWFIIILSFQFTSCLHWRPNGHSQGNFLKSSQSSTPLALKIHRDLSKSIRNQFIEAFHTFAINFRQITTNFKISVKSRTFGGKIWGKQKHSKISNFRDSQCLTWTNHC